MAKVQTLVYQTYPVTGDDPFGRVKSIDDHDGRVLFHRAGDGVTMVFREGTRVTIPWSRVWEFKVTDA